MIHICKWVQRQIKCQKDKISIIFYELYNSVNHQKFNFEKSSVRLFHIVNEYNLGCWGGGGGRDEGQFYLRVVWNTLIIFLFITQNIMVFHILKKCFIVGFVYFFISFIFWLYRLFFKKMNNLFINPNASYLPYFKAFTLHRCRSLVGAFPGHSFSIEASLFWKELHNDNSAAQQEENLLLLWW